MATINKITKLSPNSGSTLTESDIQAHLDAENTDGWNLISVDNLIGWYRFFWEKIQ